MKARMKIVALIVSMMTALTPLSHKACAASTCHARDDSSSMPCHAVNHPKSDLALETDVDHSCCRILPALPAPVREHMTAPPFHQKAVLVLRRSPDIHTVSDHALVESCIDSPPLLQRWSLSSVLLI